MIFEMEKLFWIRFLKDVTVSLYRMGGRPGLILREPIDLNIGSVSG